MKWPFSYNFFVKFSFYNTTYLKHMIPNIGPKHRKNNLCKIVIIFLSINLNMCFGYSKELSHLDGSFECPQHVLVEK